MDNKKNPVPDLLTIKGLNVLYETDDSRVFAVNGLDLSIRQGETFGLVGETGAGKTTTALSIMRLLPERIGKITSGCIILNGRDVMDMSKEELRMMRGIVVSMIFQDPMSSLNPVLTIGSQIAEVLELHHKELNRSQIDKQVDELLEMIGIPAERKNEYPHQFSGGMKQRVVIAIALACKPKLLLADEPTTALDVTIQAQVLELMNELKQKLKTSLLLITHDLGVVAETCNRVAVMYAGEIIESGFVKEVFNRKKNHPYTTGLFGSIPDLHVRTKRLSPIAGLMPDPTDLPVGCRFSDRCPKCMPKCKVERPKEFVDGTHSIWCHLFS